MSNEKPPNKAQDRTGKVVYTLCRPNGVPIVLYPPGSRNFVWEGARLFVERNGRYVPVEKP